MSQLSFDHLLNLSFAWHTRRKTGEILRVLDRGAAINRTFEVRLYQESNPNPNFLSYLLSSYFSLVSSPHLSILRLP